MTPDVIAAFGAVPTGIAGMYLMYRVMSNHIEHNTAILEKLAKSIEESNEINRVFFSWLKGRLYAE